MKTKTILLLLIVVLLSGCQKKYQYVEEVMENLMYGGHTKTTKEAETIRAKNDTLAYIEAYRKYDTQEESFYIEEITTSLFQLLIWRINMNFMKIMDY